MRRLGYILAALLALGRVAHADQGQTDNIDGMNFTTYDEGSFSANNLTAGGATYSTPGTGTIVNAPLAWWSQSAWFIDPQNSSGLASDANNGATNTTPLLTWAEMARRWNGAVLTGAYTINVMSDGNPTDSVVMNVQPAWGISSGVTVLGVTSTVYSGTVATFSAEGAGPAADDTEMSDTGLPTSFTASGLMADGLIAERTSSTAAWWFFAKDLGSKTARISVPLSTNGAVRALAGGDTYSVLKTVKVYGLQWPLMSGWSTSFGSIGYDRIYDVAPTLNWQQATYLRGWRGSPTDTDTAMTLNNYAIGSGLITNFRQGRGLFVFNHGLIRSDILVESGPVLMNGVVFQGARIQLQRGAELMATSRFDVNDTSSGMLLALTGGSAVFSGSGNMSGIGNSSNLINVLSGGSVTYDNTPVAAASTSGTQISVNGTGYAVSALPVSDPNSGSGVRKTTAPSYSAGCAQFTSSGILSSTGSSCGSGSGSVTSVTGTAQRISVVNPTTTPVVDTIGGFYSGAVSGGNEDLGTTLTNGLVCNDTTAGVSVLRSCVSATDYPAVGVATPGSCTNCSATINGNGQVTTYASGTAPVTSIGVTAPITTTGGTTPTIGIALPSGEVAFGTGTNVVGSANFLYTSAPPSLNVTNPVTTSTSTFDVADGTGSGFFRAYGQTFTVASLANHVGFGNDDTTGSAGIVVFGVATATSGSSAGSISLRGGGYDTAAENILLDLNGSHFSDGNVYIKAIAAPASPAAGIGRIYEDSTSKNIAIKNDAGTVNHGTQTFTCGANTFTTAEADTGATTCTQPAFSNLSGSATCAQLPALTGDTHSSAGTCATVTDHLTESSGPTSLHVQAIPDSAPDSTVLIRPAGTSNISGVSRTAFLSGNGRTATFVYSYLDLSIIGGFGGLWAIPGLNVADTDGNAFEMAVDFKPSAVRLVANITCNSLSAVGYSALEFFVSQNGTDIANTPAVSVPGGGCSTPGIVYDTGAVTVTASAGDRFGMSPTGSNTGGGTFSGSVTLYVYQ